MKSKYTHPTFRLSLLSLAVATASGAYAQSPDNAPISEEVIVTGYRASLQNAVDTKRDSTGVVDAISSEDIGKFPDTNLAESLQRITGVSIDRSGGEGRQITVRGLGPQFIRFCSMAGKCRTRMPVEDSTSIQLLQKW